MLFTCLFETFHLVSKRGTQWLLRFILAILSYLGRFSDKIKKIAELFPSTIYKRSKYIEQYHSTPPIVKFVACSRCHTLYKYKDCLERVGTQNECLECLPKKQVHLLKKIVTSSGSLKYYPHLVYPYVSIVSQLQTLIKRPGFLEYCESWRTKFSLSPSLLTDTYDGNIWRELMTPDKIAFFSQKDCIGLMMNIDWFQPFKHREYSVSVVIWL